VSGDVDRELGRLHHGSPGLGTDLGEDARRPTQQLKWLVCKGPGRPWRSPPVDRARPGRRRSPTGGLRRRSRWATSAPVRLPDGRSGGGGGRHDQSSGAGGAGDRGGRRATVVAGRPAWTACRTGRTATWPAPPAQVLSLGLGHAALDRDHEPGESRPTRSSGRAARGRGTVIGSWSLVSRAA